MAAYPTYPAAPTRSRPIGVTILAILTILGGVLLLLLGIVWIAVGSGLLNLRSWAWWLAIIVMVVSVVGSIAVPVAAILPGLILVYLILVRHHFR